MDIRTLPAATLRRHADHATSVNRPDIADEYETELDAIGLPHGYLQHRIHDDFEDLCRVYGREQAQRIWHEVPQETCE